MWGTQKKFKTGRFFKMPSHLDHTPHTVLYAIMIYKMTSPHRSFPHISFRSTRTISGTKMLQLSSSFISFDAPVCDCESLFHSPRGAHHLKCETKQVMEQENRKRDIDLEAEVAKSSP